MKQKQVREAAEQFVSSTFVMPIMSQAREDPFKSELFHGGFAEDAFGQQLDTILADRITKGANLPIVDMIEKQIMRAYTAREQGEARVDLHG